MEKLKEEIKLKYQEICELNIEGNESIFRGHVLPMSTIFENEFSKFLSRKLGKKFNIYIDFTLDNGRRPDIIITKKKNDKEFIKGIIELKANLGYGREFSKKLKGSIESYINDINKRNEIKIYYTRQERYLLDRQIKELSDENIKNIKKHIAKGKEKSIQIEKSIYRKDTVDYLVVSLTSDNITESQMNQYYKTFDDGEKLSVLFDGWYYNLKNRDKDISIVNKYIEKIKL